MKKTCHAVASSSAAGEKNGAGGAPRRATGGSRPGLPPEARLAGFTMLEIMIATALFSLVVAGTVGVYVMCNKIWHATAINMQAVRESSLALSRIVYGVETNKGLRTASAVTLDTNFHGWPATLTYWETNGRPPAANSTIHHICSCLSYPRDGSWRLVISNAFEGVKYLEYNAKLRSMLFCPATNLTGSNNRLTTAAEGQRLLICNYVSAARVTTNINGTITIEVTVAKQDGMFSTSNKISTMVKMRNDGNI